MINLDRIEQNIFVGTCPGNRFDIQRLKQAGMTAVLNLQTQCDLADLGIDWPSMEYRYHENEIAVYALPIVDHDDEDLIARLPAAAATLAGIIDRGHRVYVHCTAGMQRSPSVVIGFLSWHRASELQQAIDHVMIARKCDPPLHVLRSCDALIQQLPTETAS